MVRWYHLQLCQPPKRCRQFALQRQLLLGGALTLRRCARCGLLYGRLLRLRRDQRSLRSGRAVPASRQLRLKARHLTRCRLLYTKMASQKADRVRVSSSGSKKIYD